MAAATFRPEERIGLIVAIAAHGVLFTALALWQPKAEPVPPPPQRVSVTLADETALVATSPDPSADPAPDTAPMAGEAAPLPEPEPLPQVVPSPVARVQPQPVPRAVPKPVTRPVPPKRPTIADLSDPRRTSSAPVKPPPKGRPTGQPGGSRVGSDFLKGSPVGTGTGTLAAATGAQKSKWNSIIGPKVERYLNACPISGLDVEKLRIDVRFTLAADGSIQSIVDPVVLPSTITAANQAQADPFKRCVIKAIKLAAPFTGLPPEYHNDWKLRVMRLRIRTQ